MATSRLTTGVLAELNKLSASLRYRQLMHELAHSLQAERFIRKRMTELRIEYLELRQKRNRLLAGTNRHFQREDMATQYGLQDSLTRAVGYCYGVLGLVQLGYYRALQDALQGQSGQLVVLCYAEAQMPSTSLGSTPWGYVRRIYVSRLVGEQLVVSRQTVLPEVFADGWVCLAQTRQGGWTRQPAQADGQAYPPIGQPLDNATCIVGTSLVLQFFVAVSGPGQNWVVELGLA